MSDSNLDPSKWENLSLSDLTHINKFARDKLNPPGTPDEKSSPPPGVSDCFALGKMSQS